MSFYKYYDDHDYNAMIGKISGNYVEPESPFPHSFKHHLCHECGESCFTPCDLLLEYEELEEKLETEYGATSRTYRRGLQRRLSEIEEEVTEL